jgi:hypothetical protein
MPNPVLELESERDELRAAAELLDRSDMGRAREVVLVRLEEVCEELKKFWPYSKGVEP